LLFFFVLAPEKWEEKKNRFFNNPIYTLEKLQDQTKQKYVTYEGPVAVLGEFINSLGEWAKIDCVHE
jgi:hypothetical protein